MAAQELINTDFFSDANLKAYWQFNNGDLVSEVGSITATAGSGSTSDANGKFGYGRDHSGADENSNTVIPYSTVVHPDNMKTIAFWIKLNSLPAGTDFILDNSNTNSGASNFIRMAVSSAGVISYSLVNSASGVFSPQNTSALSTGTWYHIATTFNGSGSNVIMYLNGTATGAGTATSGTFSTNSIDLFIGRLSTSHGGTGVEPDMIIDDFAIFDRALSAAEIDELANGLSSSVVNIPTLALLGVG